MSLICVFVGRRQTVVATDSRLSGRGLAPIDGLEKLFQAGEHTLVAIFGLLAINAENGLVSLQGRTHELCQDHKYRDRPRELLDAISREFWPLVRSEFGRGLAEEQEPGTELIFGAVCVRRAPIAIDGRIDLLELRFPVAWTEGVCVLEEAELICHCDRLKPAGPITFKVPRDNQALSENPRMLDPDAPDDEILESAAHIFGRSEDSEVGGTMNIGVIAAAGIRRLYGSPGGVRSHRVGVS